MAGLCLVVVLGCSAVAWDGTVPGWEASITKWFNSWPEALEPIAWFVQQPGVLFAPVVVGVVIFAVTRRWQLMLPFVLVLPLKLLFEKAVVKQFVERERPFTAIGPEIEVRGGAFEGESFPSGHTTTAAATAVLLFAVLPPRWRPVPVVWAAGVGVARLYMGEHSLLDVTAGFAIGTLFAIVLWYALLNREADVPETP